MEKSRGSFSSKVGFVLAAAGSAVGLGNIWRFPYLAAEYGGGTFLLLYIILALTFGFALMVGEIAIGRKSGLSVVGAFSALDKRFKFLGVLAAIVPIIIYPYYSVIGGWVMKYTAVFLSGQATEAAQDGFFTAFISSPVEPMFWFIGFVTIVTIVVILGVEKGIEKSSKILMPLLVVLTVIVAIYCLCLPGASAGAEYYLKPDLSDINGKTFLAVLGQIFYSMSLAMGIMITYGSYMKKDNNLGTSVLQIEFFDTLIAFLAGLIIVPSVFVFSGGNEEALSAGPGLMFITLPKVFGSMGFTTIVGSLFFILVLFAALTSGISLMETIVSFFLDKTKMTRIQAVAVVYIITVLIGSLSSLGYSSLSFVTLGGKSILDMFDFLSNSILMPIVAFLTAIFIGWVITPQSIIDEVEQDGVRFKMKGMFSFIIKYIAPVAIIIILIAFVLEGIGVFRW